MLRGRPWLQLRQTQPQKVIPSELLWQISVTEEVIFRGGTIYQRGARWGPVGVGVHGNNYLRLNPRKRFYPNFFGGYQCHGGGNYCKKNAGKWLLTLFTSDGLS